MEADLRPPVHVLSWVVSDLRLPNYDKCHAHLLDVIFYWNGCCCVCTVALKMIYLFLSYSNLKSRKPLHIFKFGDYNLQNMHTQIPKFPIYQFMLVTAFRARMIVLHRGFRGPCICHASVWLMLSFCNKFAGWLQNMHAMRRILPLRSNFRPKICV